MACPIVCAPAQELTTAGATQTWNGTYYLSGTCGAQSMACLSPQCAPAGRYAAHICGFPNPAPGGRIRLWTVNQLHEYDLR